MDIDLGRYVKEAREKGMSDDAIRTAFLNMGGNINDVNAMLGDAAPEAAASSTTAAMTGVSGGGNATLPSPTVTQPSSNGDKPKPPLQQQMLLAPIGTLFGVTWRIYKERFLVLMGILTIPMIVIGIGSLMMSYGFPTNIGGGILIILGIVVFIVASVALLFAITQETGVVESYQGGIAIFWSVVWLGLLIYFATMGGMVMLVIPGIMLAIWFLFSTYILVVEGKRGLGAMSQSREYVRGYWWPVFGRYLLLIVSTVAILLVLYLPALLIFGKVVGMTIYLILILLITPFSLAYLYALYLNLIALKPDLAASQSRSGRGFIITSAIVGLVSPFLISIAMASVFGIIFLSIFKAIPQNPINLQPASNTGQFPASLATTSIPSVGGTTANSCADNDISCFIAAAKTCSPASVEWTATINFLDIFDQTTRSHLAIRGLNSSGKCSFSERVDNVNLAITSTTEQQAKAQGATDAQIQQQLQASNAQAKQSIGITTSCAFTTGYLVQMLTNWQKGNLSSSDLASGSCTATNASGKSIPILTGGSISIGSNGTQILQPSNTTGAPYSYTVNSSPAAPFAGQSNVSYNGLVASGWKSGTYTPQFSQPTLNPHSIGFTFLYPSSLTPQVSSANGAVSLSQVTQSGNVYSSTQIAQLDAYGIDSTFDDAIQRVIYFQPASQPTVKNFTTLSGLTGEEIIASEQWTPTKTIQNDIILLHTGVKSDLGNEVLIEIVGSTFSPPIDTKTIEQISYTVKLAQ